MTQTNPQPAEGAVVPGGNQVPVPDQSPGDSGQPSAEGPKSVEEVAKEVVAGRWGRGQRRKKKLEDAGYDTATVDEEVTKIFNR